MKEKLTWRKMKNDDLNDTDVFVISIKTIIVIPGQVSHVLSLSLSLSAGVTEAQVLVGVGGGL